MLRKKGVVGRFVEFYGPGVGNVPVVDRATIGNMSPEYGSTCAIFPIDALTLDYLRLDGALGGAGRARRGLYEGAGALPRQRRAGADFQRHARTRPRRGRAQHRRSWAPAGPCASRSRQSGLRGLLCRRSCRPTLRAVRKAPTPASRPTGAAGRIGCNRTAENARIGSAPSRSGRG